jgi:hypothetical protein
MNWTAVGATVLSTLFYAVLGAKTYAGRYRAFIRTKVNVGAAGTLGLNLNIQSYISDSYDTQIVYNEGTGFQLFDLGLISFPVEALLGDNVGVITVTIQGICSGAIDVDAFDLVLMPVDEPHMEVIKSISFMGTADMGYPIKVITSDLKQGAYGYILVNDTGANFMTVDWTYPAWIQLKIDLLSTLSIDPNEEYWIIFFMYGIGIAANSFFQYVLLPNFDKTQRYLLARGNE